MGKRRRRRRTQPKEKVSAVEDVVVVNVVVADVVFVSDVDGAVATTGVDGTGSRGRDDGRQRGGDLDVVRTAAEIHEADVKGWVDAAAVLRAEGIADEMDFVGGCVLTLITTA